MRDDDRIDIGEFVRGAERTAEERRRKRLATWRAKTSLLAPLLVIIGALAMYGDWETPYDRRKPADDNRDDVASFRASPLPSNPAALPVLVQRDIEQLVAVDRTDVTARAARDGTALRTERRVTLIRAYAVLRYDVAGPLLEDVVDTATDERVRAEAVTMLGYVGHPSWRLLDELVDARDAGRDLMPHLRALRYFFAMASEPPPWIRDAVRELVAIAEECPRLECRRAAAGAFARAIRLDLAEDWIHEVERLSLNRDPSCRVRAVDSLRGATASINPKRCAAILARALASPDDNEVTAAASRATNLPRPAIPPSAWEELRSIASDGDRALAVRVAASRTLRKAGDPRQHHDTPVKEPASKPDSAALHATLRKIFADRSNTPESIIDVVQEERRSFAVDPLRRVAREIRREVLK